MSMKRIDLQGGRVRAAAIVLVWAIVAPGPSSAGQPVTVPVDVGVGPAAYILTGRVAADQAVHTGVKISVQAVIDQATLRQHQDRIPPRMRQQVLQMKEVRFSPSILIPDALIVSPRIHNTEIYGVTWRPLSLGVSLVDGPGGRLRLAAGLLATYAYIASTVPEIPTTHFLRPGIDLSAEVELPVTATFLVSFGWASGFYIPQVLGGFAVSDSGPTGGGTIWHLGQAFLQLHVRFPYTTRL
jgi:hypothetical protein